MTTDAELLQCYAVAGDEQAFRDIVLRYQGMVLGVARSHLQGSDCDDVVQETFLTLARQSTEIRPGCLAAWLHATARNHALKLLRRERREQDRVHHDNAKAVTRTDRQADDEVAAEEPDGALLKSLDLALVRLKDADRDILLKRFCSGRSLAEIAQELGLAIPTVHGRIQRALETIRFHMKQTDAGVGAIALCSLVAIEPPASLLPKLLAPVLGRTLTPVSTTASTADHVWRWLMPTVVTLVLLGGGAACWRYRSVLFGGSTAIPPTAPAITVQQVTGTVWAEDAAGHRLPATVGLTLPVGFRLHAETIGGAVLGMTHGGRFTLRETSALTIRADGIAMERGAAVVEVPSGPGTAIRLPRLGIIGGTGTVWLLTQTGFDRVDVVTGAMTVASGDGNLTVNAGKAVARGPGCPDQPFTAVDEELSPRYGGLFFRRVVEHYALGRKVLTDGPGKWVVEDRLPITSDLASTISERARNVGLVCNVGLFNGKAAFSLHCPDPTMTRGFAIAPMRTGRGSCQVTETDLTLANSDPKRFLVRNTQKPRALLSNSRWSPGDLSSTPPPATITTNQDAPLRWTVAQCQVGATPDGQAVLEESTLMSGNPQARWSPPFLSIGSALQEWCVLIPPGGTVHVSALTFGSCDLPPPH